MAENEADYITIKANPLRFLETLTPKRVPRNKAVFVRDATEKMFGQLYIPDDAQQASLSGTVTMLAEDTLAWFKEGARVIIKGNVPAAPMGPALKNLVIEIAAVVLDVTDIKTLEDAVVRPDFVMLRMEPDITHERGFELPDKAKKANKVGRIVSVGANVVEWGAGQRVILSGLGGVRIKGDLVGIELGENPLCLVPQAMIACEIQENET